MFCYFLKNERKFFIYFPVHFKRLTNMKEEKRTEKPGTETTCSVKFSNNFFEHDTLNPHHNNFFFFHFILLLKL